MINNGDISYFMPSLETYYSIARYAPGSYIHALETNRYASLAEKEQANKIASKITRLDLSPKVGTAWFPTIKAYQGKRVVGVLLCMNTQKTGTPLSPKNQDQIRTWLSALLDGIPVEIPQLYIHNLPPNWEMTGQSWGLAGIISTISALLQRKPAEAVLCSGSLSKERGIITSIAHSVKKTTLCQWEAPEVDPIIIHQATPIVLYIKALFGALWKSKILDILRITPRALAEESLNQYRQRNTDTAQRMAQNVLNMNGTSEISKILAYFVLGSIYKHTGQSAESITNLTAAREYILTCEEIDQLDFYLRFRLEANLGIAMLHNLQITKAISIVEQGLRDLSSIHAYHRDLNWRSVSLRLAGTLRWLYISNGEAQKAKDIQLAWPLSKSRVPQHLCRALYSLSDVYWRLGDTQNSRVRYREAKVYFADVRPVERPLTKRYLTLCGIRIGEESAPKRPLLWSDQLIQQLETLESALQNQQLPTLFSDHIQPIPQNLTTLFVLSGFIARHIVQYGSEPIFNPFLNRFAEYKPKMPTHMQHALEELMQGNAKEWSKIAPY